ncbi:filamentous hemagglutinin N-terminal domain-containing protein [Sporomusa sp. GT1]|uniref:two-partner secretion domain-containing protein n=1 Tax=Sporomusa sp. GT1 TaxID=1534747 RepID=UPI001662E280|nr:filamentous hemagglutinin N-terminal domain-containing protein [Sporomusa sp. GT1]
MRISRKQRRARLRRMQAQNSLKNLLKKGARIAAAAAFLWQGLLPQPAYALPTDGQVTAGSAIINQAGSVMTIQQQTALAAINWQSFGIAAHEAVRFFQPGANSIALNRVIGSNPSAIFGKLSANGKVFLVNQNGVYFAPGAQVNVGGLVATTLSITDADFMAGRYAFANQGSSGSVINQGQIVAENQGLVALLAPEVKNEGIIVAKKGSVILGAGNQATLDFNGDGKVQLALGEGALKAVADNKGLIEADGGLVLMTAKAGQDLTSAVVNQNGIIRARSLDGAAGSVALHAADGTVHNSGVIDASAMTGKGGNIDIFGKDITLGEGTQLDVTGSIGGGYVRVGGDWQGTGDAPHARTVTIHNGAAIVADAIDNGQGGTVAVWSDGTTRFNGAVSARGGANGGDGGKVETSGHVLAVGNTASVNASASKGQGGEWLLDPINVIISDSGSGLSGPAVSAAAVSGALNTGTGVTITTTTTGGEIEDGNITVSSNIVKTAGGDATLILKAHNNITVDADITSSSGKLNLDLHADFDNTAGGAIKLNSGKQITTNGGTVLLHGGTGITGYAKNTTNDDTPGVDIQGSITTGGGSITLYGLTNSNTTDAAGVSLTGELSSGGGAIGIYGKKDNVASGGVGVKLGGTIDAGAGLLTVSGENTQTNGNGTAIALQSGAAIAAANTTLIGNAMTFDSAARVTGSTGGTLTLQTKDATRNIFVGTSGSGGLDLTGNLFSGYASSIFKSYDKTVIGHDSGTGAITVNNATFGNDVTLQATGTNGKINIAGALNAGTNTVTLKTGADSGGMGVITAGELNLQGNNAVFSLSGANAVGNLAGSVKSVAFTNAGSFTVGEAGGANGLSIAGDSTLKSTAGGVTISKNITSRSGTNTLTVAAANTGSGNIAVDSGATIGATAGKLNVTFNAGKDIVLDNGIVDSKGGKVALTAQTGKLELANTTAKVMAGAGDIYFRSNTWGVMNGAVSGTGKLIIDTSTANGTIGVGTGTGDLQIIQTSFNRFTPGFSEIIIGRTDGTGTVNVGQLAVQDKLTVQAGGATGRITFTTGADLRTNNKELKLDAGTIDFTNTATVEAGSGDLILSADAITNWTNAKFDAVTGGQLLIAPKTLGRELQIGGTADAGKLSVDNDGMTKIAAGQFTNVTIGHESGTGAVSVDSFTVPSTNLTVRSPGGVATINNGATITGTTGKTLTFKVKSLTQNDSSALSVDNLLLDGNGSGAFNLSSATNAIGTVAAKVGSLKLYNGTDLSIGTVGGVDGITATGKVELATDRMTVNKSVRTGGELHLYSQTPTKTIQVGGTDNNSDLYLRSDYFNSGDVLGGDYSKIILGRLTEKFDTVDHSGNINIHNTTFSSNLDIRTTASANLSGTVKIGSASPYKDLSITADQATLPNGSNIYVRNLHLDLKSGLGGLAGKVNGTGDLTIKVPDTKDIYISDTYDTAGGGYKITYTAINNVLTGFKEFAVTGKQDVYFDEGSINKSVKVASGAGSYGVTVQGNVGISGDGTEVDISGGNFTMNSGKSLTVSGSGAIVNITADNTVTLNDSASIAINGSNVNVTVSGNELALGANAKIDLGSDVESKFTLAANKLTETSDSIANITGKGTLNLGPRDAAVTLDVNNNGSGTGLVITQAQLNGGLFGNEFKDLTLGNASGTGLVTIDGVSVDNSVTVQNGATGEIKIGSGGLNVNGSNKVTLKANKINNSSGTGVIDAGSGTINLYTDDLSSLTGSKTVKGSGTLGIATYNGGKVISLGNVQNGTGSLWLTNNLLTNTFDTTFDHYRIGNTNQGSIYVNNFDLGSSRQNTTLIAQNIVFEGNANLDGKTLALNASNSASQTNGIITADSLALQGGTYNLTASANQIGTLAANAQQVKVKAETLIIGEIATPANGTVSGITASGSGDAVVLETTEAAGLTVNKDIKATHATNGNITLTADKMTFGGGIVQGKGTLNVQQYNSATTLGIGTGAGTLQLGAGLFNGQIFKDGFEHVYLGREDGTGAVEIGGSLTFVDPTTIRSPGTGGSITVKENASITAGNNSLEFRTVTLTTEANSTIDTGSGTLTLTVDNLELAGDDNQAQAPISGTGDLILQTLTKERDLYLGETKEGDGLFLKSGYFDGTTAKRVFRDRGDGKIIIGRPDGTGTLYQIGTTGFTDTVIIRQASETTSTGKVNVRGNINTNDNDFTVESKWVDIDAKINAGTGDVSLTADKLTIAKGSKIKSSGDLTIKTYSEETNINLGSSGGTSDLNLDSGWFDGTDRVFEDGFKNINIGRDDGTGMITVNDNFKVTDNLTIKNGSGMVTVTTGKNLDLSGNNLTVTTKEGAITVPGTVTNVETLTATSTTNTISFNSKGNTIGKLGNITAGKGIDIKDSGGLTISGTVDGNTTGASGQNITVWTKDGNLVLGENGKVVSHGDTPVYLTAEGGHFTNNNTRTNSKDMIDPGSSRWVISTEDSLGDNYGKLTGDFRRYGTDYDQVTTLPGTYVGNGTTHKYQPVAKIYGEKVYGSGNAEFFNGGQFKVEIADWAQRQALDDAFLGDWNTDQKESTKYNWGSGVGSGTKPGVNYRDGVKGTAYGTGNGDAALQVVYNGLNPLNYKVETEFYVTPKEVTVTAKDYSKIYDGQHYIGSNGFTGGNGWDYSGFISGENASNVGLGGTVKFGGGSADNAKNAGEYTIGIDEANSNLAANNYSFKYVDGILEITKKEVTVKAGDQTKVYDGKTYSGGAGDMSYDGFVTGEDKGVIKKGSVWDTGGANKDVGNYTLNIDGDFEADNYTFTYENGMLTITPKEVTVTANDHKKTYDGSAYVSGTHEARCSGFVAGEGDASGAASGIITSGSVKYGGTADGAVNVGGYIIDIDGDFKADNYTFKYVDGTLTITRAGLSPEEIAQREAQTTTQPKPGNLSGITPGLPGSGNLFPALPEWPDMTPPVNTGSISGLPSGVTGDVTIQTGGSSSNHIFATENGGFALRLDRPNGEERDIAGERRTSGAVPVLYANSGEQKLDGIYTINYNPDKLSILPSAQSVTIPRLDEVAPDVNKGFSMVYKTEATGSFEVAFGNGIVTVHPLDQQALTTITGDNREPGKAVLATGILTAVEDLGVMPDQIRAIYIFMEINSQE